MALAYVYPLEASLKFDTSAPPEHRQKTIAALEGAQPLVKRAIVLSMEQPESVSRSPTMANSSADGWKSMGELRLILGADASRCFDAGDMVGAAERLEALARIGLHQIGRSDSDIFAAGIGTLTLASRKTVNMAEAGMLATLPDASRESLCTTLAEAAVDPEGFAVEWERRAGEALAEARTTYAGRDGLEQLRSLIEEWGIEPATPGAMGGLGLKNQEMITAAFLVNPGPRELRRLSERDVRQSLDEAERLIPIAAQALRVLDVAAAFGPIVQAMRADKAQLTKLVIGTPGALLDMLRDLREDLDRADRALSPSP